MKKKRSMLPFYIILVPVVLVMVVLNSGLLQRYLPAAELLGQRTTAAQYNYYYHTALNAFLEQGAEALAAQGYDALQKPQQQDYDATTTWQEHLAEEAQARFVWVAHYNRLADEAGFPEEEACLPAYEAWLARATAFYEASGIGSLQNYLTAYYGTGMTEEAFRSQFLREERAEAYYAALYESTEPSQAEVAAWLAQNEAPAYRTANLHLMVLDAEADRFTGEVGARQREDLIQKLERLAQRAGQEDAAFETLAETYCTQETLQAAGGLVRQATRDQLPGAVAGWCLEETAQPGDWLLEVDEATGQGYLARFDSYGQDAGELAARDALKKQTLDEAYEAAAGRLQVDFLVPGRWLVQ